MTKPSTKIRTETRSVKVQSAIKPSTHKALLRRARQAGADSVSAYIARLIESDLARPAA